MTTPRELFHKIMRFECPGVTYKTLGGGIWPGCFERWREEGMPPELKSSQDLLKYFDLCEYIWGGPRAETFVFPRFEKEVVSETDSKVTYVNAYGIVCTEFKNDSYKSMPHWEKYPISCRKDWQEYRKRLVWPPDRVGEECEKSCKYNAGLDHLPVIVTFGRAGSLYGALRDLAGVETISYLFYDDPDLVAEMMDTLVELFIACTSILFRDYKPDAVDLWEDMAYKNGPLLGIPHVREFMLPRYKVMVEHLRKLGIPFILLDSDGDISSLIPIWLEAGIDGVEPMEVQAGMDVARYRELYPNLLMFGGVDKKSLAAGPEAIDKEMEKVKRTISTGGYIPWFDHSLPSDVSWQNFVYYVEQLKAL